MLGLDEKDLVSGPKPDDLELVECHEDWSHTGTPQWACSEDNPRAGDSSEAPPHGWSKCPRSKPPMRLRTLCRPWAASWAREEEPEEREGLRRGGAPRRSDARRPSTSPNLADPARFRAPKAPASRKFQPLRMLTNPLRKKAPEQAP